MEYLPISFLAGILTVLAPCVFTLLPVVLGGSLTGKTWKKPAVIIASLSVSIFIFTIFLKASTLLIDVDPDFWKYLSGGILILFGLFTLFPYVWGMIDYRLGLSKNSDELLRQGSEKSSVVGDILAGAALGPVFSSCSPTYAIIIATILPQDAVTGIINLLVYIAGLALILTIISISGQSLIRKTKWAVNPNGIFKKSLGVIFVLVGVLILSGLDKKLETYLLDRGILDVTKIEINLLNDNESKKDEKKNSSDEVELNVVKPYKAPEITGIENWINSDPQTLASLKGKVVLIDFWTYSCINCIRTLPYVTSWYDKYKDDGFVVIGVHSPEFAFEKVKTNVESAVKKNDIKYPVAMDNNLSTWRAFQNRYWPANYFIDRNGNVVHTHFGEGDYEENEKIIQYLLGVDNDITKKATGVNFNPLQTPETYLGYYRFENFLNVDEFKSEREVNYSSMNAESNSWSLKGNWLVSSEHLVSKGDMSKLFLTFSAKEVYLVMGSEKKVNVTVKIFDGNKEVSSEMIKVQDYGLYTVAKLPEFVEDYRLEITAPENVQMNAFTFGG